MKITPWNVRSSKNKKNLIKELKKFLLDTSRISVVAKDFQEENQGNYMECQKYRNTMKINKCSEGSERNGIEQICRRKIQMDI